VRARLVRFGQLEIDGAAYDRDVVIERGKISRRRKGPSKQFRDDYGHTPLSVAEDIPWPKSGRLIIGTGANGQLPVMPEVYQEAQRRGVELVTKPTREICQILSDSPDDEISAILHVTC
jgi:hypothetical protein